jgi:flagellar protein FliO/FliZ
VSPEKNPPTAPAVGTALPQLAEEPHSGKPLFALPELSGLKLAVEVPLGSVELALRAGGSLVLVLLLFASLVFLLRRFRGGAAGLRDSANRFLRLRERIDLGARREIRVVEVQGRLLVVGVTNQGITLLTELDAAASPAEQAPPPAGGPLLRVLRKMNPGR